MLNGELIQKPKALLIDLDGTICDSRLPISYLNGEKDKDNYDVYFRMLDKVKPIQSVINTIIQQCEVIGGDRAKNPKDRFAEVTLVFLTSRNAGYYSMMHTMNFVEKYFEFPLSSENVKADFYFRPINDHTNTVDYKMKKFNILKNLYFFTHIYEDELANIEMFQQQKEEKTIIHWVKNSYNFALHKQPDKFTKNIDRLIIHEV